MFQSRKTRWRKLENAAKIFPATSNKKDERVFRFACELTEDVQEEPLQEALDRTMQSFSLFSCVLRKGVFWNYFEESNIKPVVRQEYKPACSRLYERDKQSLLFEVTYYKKRINLEIFHALADGTGTLQFLKSLVYQYLMQVHPKEVPGPLTRLDFDVSDQEKAEDGFQKYYEKDISKIKIPKYKAYQFSSPKRDVGQLKLIEGRVSAKQVVALSKKYNTTVTVFLTAVFLCAIQKEMSQRDKKRPVALMIPVNLRNFFPSESVRNFFGWIDIGYDFKYKSAALEDVITYVAAFFKKEITKERMAVRMNGLVGLEQNIFMRIIPLEIKLFFMQLGTFSSMSADTAVFSNVGRIQMPEECSPYIKLFDIFTSTPKIELCMCSYQDEMVLSFTTAYEDVNIFRNYFRMLTKQGVEVEITSLPE